MEIAILFWVYISLSHTKPMSICLSAGTEDGIWTHRIRILSPLYMPILLLPHIPSAATETIPLFLLDLHFAGKFEAVNWIAIGQLWLPYIHTDDLMVGLEGFEPSTNRLWADCSTIELKPQMRLFVQPRRWAFCWLMKHAKNTRQTLTMNPTD